MLTIHDRKNTTQRLRDKLPEPENPLLTGGQEETVKPALVYMPFDNCGQYADLWKVCSGYLEEFEAIDTLSVKVIESKANKENTLY